METAGHHHQSSKLKSMEDDHDLLVVDIEKKKRASCNSTIINFKKASSSINGVMSSSSSSTSSQRCCQADKCSVDLSDAKQYHRRHKVCEYHAKAQAAVVAGLRQRFCQQCSRFHEVMEFDESKRSCRRRLAGHNERRRRTTSSSSSSSTAATEATNNNNAEGSIGRKLGTGTINSMCGQVDDRGRRIQENATNYKINNFHLR